MKNLLTLLIFLFAGLCLHAQYKVRFILQEKNPPKHDSIYIAGYFNNWNTADIKYMLQPMDAAHKSIVLTLPAGLCEYKFTRGSWLQVEKDYFCSEMENRRTEIHRDTTINITIDFWMDDCNIENLAKVIQTQPEDTNKVNTLNATANLSLDLTTSLDYANRAIALSDKIKFTKGKGTAYRVIGYAYYRAGKYPESRKFYLLSIETEKGLEDKSEIAGSYLNLALTYLAEENYPEWLQNNYYAIKFFEQSSDKMGMANAYASIGDHEVSDGNDSDALKNYQLSLKLYEAVGAGNGTWGVARISSSIAYVYLRQGKYTEALVKDSIALKIYRELGLGYKYAIANIFLNMGNVYQKQGDLALAAGDAITGRQKLAEGQKISLEALKIHEELNNSYGIASAFFHLGMINMKLKNLPAARAYLEKGLNIFKSDNNKWGLENSYFLLSRLDSMDGSYKKAYENYKLYTLYRDSVYNEGDVKKNVQIKMQYEFDKKEDIAKAEQGKKDAETKRIKNQQYFTIAGLVMVVLAVVIIAFIQYRNNKHKQKANILLTHQKEKVESTLSELKSTQAQLIQSEKMASLGELTAGIAHEIQNPLNFVNNFSEVNSELIEELKNEKSKLKSERDEQLEEELLNDIAENEKKINHHGKRADAIVKGMLQHSQASTGQKELTNINKLADEYLRLAYHGLRAKDNTFNATLKTDFDETIDNINIIPQDIGRVLLNLYNNAFYAVNEKKKQIGESYEPAVSMGTKKINDKIEIRVADNGNGIPQKILDKIFQPFFTTKPTGQGTGLGLSLSYDIIKAHGGEIKVETKEGESSEFIIQLPI